MPESMKKPILILILMWTACMGAYPQKIFDVHIHGSDNIPEQIKMLESQGVYKAAISTSWSLQVQYQGNQEISILQGLMMPCPNGKVPYSSQVCFEHQGDFPHPSWVEQLMKENKIHFLGEVLTQYYGISPSDPKMYPYYELAEKYGIPVGIHFGLAGPDHGAPNFKVSLGTPMLLEEALIKYPKLKFWIMHAGAPFLDDTMAIMKYYSQVYMDISALNNPYIFPESDFQFVMKRLIDAGFEDRIMFGSDNGPLKQMITNMEKLDFLTDIQKQKIYYKNAEAFFNVTTGESRATHP